MTQKEAYSSPLWAGTQAAEALVVSEKAFRLRSLRSTTPRRAAMLRPTGFVPEHRGKAHTAGKRRPGVADG
jgi:hypothetical protein